MGFTWLGKCYSLGIDFKTLTQGINQHLALMFDQYSALFLYERHSQLASVLHAKVKLDSRVFQFGMGCRDIYGPDYVPSRDAF